MKPKTATDYSFVCVGKYTRNNLEDLLSNTSFKKVSQIFTFILPDIPQEARADRFDLCVQEYKCHTEYLRPDNLFEILYFAKKFPDFVKVYGAIECSQDPYLDAFMKEVELKLGRIVLSFDSRLNGLVLSAEDYLDTDYEDNGRASKITSPYRLVVPKPSTLT